MKISLSQVAVGIKEYVIMTLGMFMYAFGWVACIIPAGGMGGGATGLSMLLNAVFPALSIGTFVFIINALLLIIAGFIIGWNFGIKTIYCIIVLSIAMDAWDYIIPPGILVEYTQNIDSHNILLVILGAIIAGSGVAIGFSQGGSTGGTDIVAMILQKYFKLKFSSGILLVDSMVVLFGIIVLQDWKLPLYSLITIFISTRLIDYVIDGASYDKLLFINTDGKHTDELRSLIINDIKRGGTYIKASGMYSGAEKEMIFLVVSRNQVVSVQNQIKKIDPRAFLVVVDAYDTYGEGFKPFPEEEAIGTN